MKKLGCIIVAVMILFCGCSNKKSEKIGEVKVSVVCNTIFDNIDNLSESARDFLPKDGIIIKEQPVFLYEGDSVLSLIERVCEKEKIELYYKGSRANAYIAGIGGILEFDCGAESGWNFKVNGEVGSVGVSVQEIGDGDILEFVYTCAMGTDIN